MPETPGRCVLLSLVTALAGAAALSLTLTSPGPSVGAVPTAVAAPAVVRQLVQAAPVPAVDALVREQESHGLTCAMSASQVPLCVHGPDEPHGAAGAAGVAETPRGGSLGCYGDGTSGPRVRAVYARPQSAPDRYASSLPAIRSWAAGVSSQFDQSARATGGRRHVRFATTPGAGCALTVLEVVLPDKAFGTFRATIDALQARGLDVPWSKYLVWSDASGYCGMGTTYVDDSPGLDNLNNGRLPGYARIDRRCWGKVEAHELVHMLGGVQRSAPNATAAFHCSDGHDVLCYDDGSAGSRQRSVCPASRAQLLDCRNDDYYSTSAPRGSYLQTHWNTARSSFLSPVLSEPPPTPPAAAPSRPATTPSPKPSPSASPSATPQPSGPVLLPRLPLPTPTLVPSAWLLGGAL